jgi:hypothetical protein
MALVRRTSKVRRAAKIYILKRRVLSYFSLTLIDEDCTDHWYLDVIKGSVIKAAVWKDYVVTYRFGRSNGGYEGVSCSAQVFTAFFIMLPFKRSSRWKMDSNR